MAQVSSLGPAGPGEGIAAVDLFKRFGDIQAASNVSMEIAVGEVHAVVGENGAGKSTVAKMLAGYVQPDSGAVVRNFRDEGGLSAQAGLGQATVGYLPQQLSLVPSLTVVENYLLSLSNGSLLLQRAAALRSLSETAGETGMSVPLQVTCGQLSLAERQLGEILVALTLGARVLLLDEPSSSLGPVEVRELIKQIRGLAERGVGIMLVTHRLDEVLNGADRVTVMRAGRVVHSGLTGDLDSDSLAALMVGERGTVARPGQPKSAETRLRVDGLVAKKHSGPTVTLERLEVASGEIVGVAGVGGNGQTCLAEALVGVIRPRSGDVSVDGRVVTGRPQLAAALGVAYIPEERERGLVGSLSVMDNVSVAPSHQRSCRHGTLRSLKRLMHIAQRVCGRYDVRPPKPWVNVGALSGGNQQKVMVGRELDSEVVVLVAHGPTQGLDLAASARIQEGIRVVAEEGAAVVLISAELDEIVALSHRILVLSQGNIVDEFSVDDFDELRVGRAMAGLS